jgi:hypothetical protein
MDQSKTQLPRPRRVSKDTANLQRVKTHLVGIIAHTGYEQQGKHTHGWVDAFQWPHGSSLTASLLLDTISRYTESLPEVMYLQMDNCSRENKNQYLLCLLALLVQLKVFKKVRFYLVGFKETPVNFFQCSHILFLSIFIQIRLNFLPVGHTHEDIDAFFGTLSQYLQKTDLHTITGLHIKLKYKIVLLIIIIIIIN